MSVPCDFRHYSRHSRVALECDRILPEAVVEGTRIWNARSTEEPLVIDAVLSYHMNPQTCGVAKFNHRLAKELGVPCQSLSSEAAEPLVSVKFGEVREHISHRRCFDLFIHDQPVLDREWSLILAARSVYAGNHVLADVVRPRRVDVIDACCPSTVDGDPTRGAYRVLTFGMAHKRLLHHYEALKVKLDAEHEDYTVEMSTAIHEGTPWDEGHARSMEDMRAIFADKLRVLGFLGDDALAKELHEVDAVAVYFDPAFRANNTSAWAAIDAGKTLYTNRDEHSPKEGERRTWKQLTDLLCAR